jgi:peptidoglycan/xylan/chitin deacetylase (PgdA/CDA1 family)
MSYPPPRIETGVVMTLAPLLILVSSLSFASLDANFSNQAATQQPSHAEVLIQKIDQLVVLEYQGEGFLRQVEHDLKLPGPDSDRNASFAYQKFIVESEILQNSLAEDYEKLLVTQINSNEDSTVRVAASRDVEKVDRYISDLELEDRLQLVDLAEKLSVAAKPWQTYAANTFSLAPIDYRSEWELNTDRYWAAQKINRKVARHRKEAPEAPPRGRGKGKKSRSREKDDDSSSGEKDRDNSSRESDETPAHPIAQQNFEIHPGEGVSGEINPNTTFPDGSWALTFDDGPTTKVSPEIMQALRAHRDNVNTNGALGTHFYVNGMVLDEYKGKPGTVARRNEIQRVIDQAIADGDSVNAHSWTHPSNFGAVHGAKLQHEVIDAVTSQNALNFHGHSMRFFRCPGGDSNKEVRAAIASLGLINAGWTVDSHDWKIKNGKRSAALAIARMQKKMQEKTGGVVLMHELHDFSATGAKLLLQWIQTHNNSGRSPIRLYTLDQLVDLRNQDVIARNRKP